MGTGGETQIETRRRRPYGGGRIVLWGQGETPKETGVRTRWGWGGDHK